MNHEKPLLCHVFQLKFGQVYSAGPCQEVSFSCGACIQYLVYLVLTVINLFRLIIHNNKIKTSACIPHISLATFMIVANKYIYIGCYWGTARKLKLYSPVVPI
jgi:hypothetical protein